MRIFCFNMFNGGNLCCGDRTQKRIHFANPLYKPCSFYNAACSKCKDIICLYVFSSCLLFDTFHSMCFPIMVQYEQMLLHKIEFNILNRGIIINTFLLIYSTARNVLFSLMPNIYASQTADDFGLDPHWSCWLRCGSGAKLSAVWDWPKCSPWSRAFNSIVKLTYCQLIQCKKNLFFGGSLWWC